MTRAAPPRAGRLLASFLAVPLSVALLAACSPSMTPTPAVSATPAPTATPTPPVASGTLRLWMTPLDRIDPIRSRDAAFLAAVPLVYGSLYGIGDDDLPAPDLAAASATFDGGATWTVRLRAGVRFHDGTPLVAADVAASARLYLENGDGALRDALVLLGPTFTADDDATLTVRLAVASDRLPWLLRFPVVPARFAGSKAPDAKTPIPGTGPFRIAAYDAGKELRLERVEPVEGQVDRIRLVVFADLHDALVAFHSDRLDVLPMDEDAYRTFSLRKDTRLSGFHGDVLLVPVLCVASNRLLADPARRDAVRAVLEGLYEDDARLGDLCLFPSSRGLTEGLGLRIFGPAPTGGAPSATPGPTAEPTASASPGAAQFPTRLDVVARTGGVEEELARAVVAALLAKGIPAAFRGLDDARLMDAYGSGRYDVAIRSVQAPLVPSTSYLASLAAKGASPGALPLIRTAGILLGPRVFGDPRPVAGDIYRGIEETWVWSGS